MNHGWKAARFRLLDSLILWLRSVPQSVFTTMAEGCFSVRENFLNNVSTHTVLLDGCNLHSSESGIEVIVLLLFANFKQTKCT